MSATTTFSLQTPISKYEGQQILQAIAALADGVTRRDRQLSAMAQHLSALNATLDARSMDDVHFRGIILNQFKAISSFIERNQQKTMELFVAIDVRLKAMEKKAKRKR